MPAAVPGAVEHLTAVAGDGQVELTWELPIATVISTGPVLDDGGEPITGVEYRWKIGREEYGPWQTIWSRGVDEGALKDEVESLLSDFNLWARKDAKARELAFGDMRRLEICRALATKPELLLLDEPASGLSPVETAHLMEDLRRLSEAGMTIVLIEHDMNVALGLSDRVVVLNFGRMLADGPPAEIRNAPVVIEAYLGSTAETADA